MPQGTKQARQVLNSAKENIIPNPIPILRVPLSPKSQFLAQELDGRFSRGFKKSLSWLQKDMYRSVSVEPCPWNSRFLDQMSANCQGDRRKDLGAIHCPTEVKQNGSRSEGASPVPKQFNKQNFKVAPRLNFRGTLPSIKSPHNTQNATSRSRRRSNINMLIEDKKIKADTLKPIKKQSYAALPFDLREDIHINNLERKSLCILAQ